MFLVAPAFYTLIRASRHDSMSWKIFEWAVFVWMIMLLISLFYYFYSSLKDIFMILWRVLFAGSFVLLLLPVIRKKSAVHGTDLWFAGMYLASIILLWLTNPITTQLPYKSYSPHIENPAYQAGAGPVVLIDEGHQNFHIMSGRYYAFANVLRKDGYRVLPLSGPVTRESLSGCRILVIANAGGSCRYWQALRVYPS